MKVQFVETGASAGWKFGQNVKMRIWTNLKALAASSRSGLDRFETFNSIALTRWSGRGSDTTGLNALRWWIMVAADQRGYRI